MVRFAGLSCNSLFLAIFVLILFVFHFKLIRTAPVLFKKVSKHTIILFVGLLSLTFFAEFVPIDFQLKHLIQFFYTEVIPFLLIPLVVRTESEYKTFLYMISLAALFNVSYGLFTFITNTNPIVDIFGTNMEDFDTDIALSEEGRYGLSSKAVGIYSNKIFMSLVSMLIFTFFYNKVYIRKNYILLLLAIAVLTCFLTTQRTALFCILIFVFLVANKKKIVLYFKKYFFILSCLFIVVFFSPPFKIVREFVYSTVYIFDDKKQEDIGNQGSSVSMRFGQIKGVVEVVGPFVFQGLGYGFGSYREGTSLDIAGLYGLESFAFKILVNSGLVGFFLWILFLYRIIKLSISLGTNEKRYNIAYSFSYLIAIMMTDTSGSFFLFLVFLGLNTNGSSMITSSNVYKQLDKR